MIKRWLSVGLILTGLLVSGFSMFRLYGQKDLLLSPSASQTPPNVPQLDASAYAFEVLRARTPQASEIRLINLMDTTTTHSSYQFAYKTDGKTVSGQLNVPATATPSAGFPAIIMLRGFVDPEIYTTGTGTKNAASVFAANGFITLAPDFLGFGSSDMPDQNPIIARLSRPNTVIDLLASLNSFGLINDTNVFLWGHSNGGQIALSVLEITQKRLPTTLWAPVSKPFPYSILYYTDEFEDQGKAMRKELADFESNHDVNHYSIDKYWEWINAPIQIHQGGADAEVPLEWSQTLADTLKQHQQITVTYYEYPNSDHNLRPDWNTVVARDIAFFKSHLTN